MDIMWTEIIIALLSALIGTYFGTYFLSRRETVKVKRVREIAIRAMNIVSGYSKHNGTYDMACQELNAKINIAEKRAVIVALHKIGLPIQIPANSQFDIKNILLSNDVIDKDFLADAKVQIEHGYCDHLFYEDPEKYFNENLRIYTLRKLAKRLVDELLGHSTFCKNIGKVVYPENWVKNFTWGELKAIYVFRLQVTADVYFKADGTPDIDKQLILKREVDTGLWDNYLLWTNETYDNLSLGTNISNKFLQMANAQQVQQPKE